MSTDLEDRLRDALSARAGGVAYDPSAYDAVVARRVRRRLARRYVPAAALGVVAVLAGVALVTADGPATRRPATGTDPARLRPRYAIGIVDGEARVVDAADLSATPLGRVPMSSEVTAVASVGDDRTFYLAGGEECRRTGLSRWVAQGDGLWDIRKVPGVDLPPGRVVALAVSADAARLAYVLATGPRCAAGDLHVRDLATGADRVWPRAEQELGNLAWAPDGRHLAVAVSGRAVVLDTDAGPGGLDVAGTRFDHPGCTYVSVAYRLAELVAVEDCGRNEGRVVTVEGTSARILFSTPALARTVSFDATGETALFVADAVRRLEVYRWSGGTLSGATEAPEGLYGIDW